MKSKKDKIVNTMISVTNALKGAGIDIKNRKHGPHALRHSLASNMLSNNTPLPTISNVLGHKSTATTQIYLKIDINNLAKCALPLFGGDI